MTFEEFKNIITDKFPEVTPEQMEQFRLMDELYRDWNSKINVVSRKDIDELYRHHVLHSLGIAAYLKTQGDIFPKEFDITPQPGWEVPEVDPEIIRMYVEGEKRSELRKLMPPLLKGYLRLGARFSREPVLDKEFGAIDFLVLLNFDEMDSKYARHFL